ncbi:glycosyltransferase family 2 protein [Novosphingobium umbonatum]|uniref:Glycosyltransferase family 2 protein n=1 Tax=Novosphingobium umbonatum TaxID=1908524 RepID=A0A3S2UT57_9SPHN|nr:glycosyltransferase [Novosphingobium umbonatum]RVU04261.1 glycosyltransferase family 2 protein [Novosphingobium umbonatum]
MKPSQPPPRIAVLATVFNRREVTLRRLHDLREAAKGLDYRVYLVDDACPQGTGDAVRASFAEVTVIDGTGNLWWNGGMRTAWTRAIEDKPDYYLWWNDDLMFAPGSIAAMFEFHHQKEREYGPKVITVGKVADPDTGAITYGAMVRARGLSRLRFQLAPDDGQPCATMNGNAVIVPASAVEDIGIHSPHYAHSTGDIDYGLRANLAGYRLFQTMDVVGTTPFNIAFELGQSKLNWANRRFIFGHPKGVPWREWLHFCRRFGGPLWPVNFLYRYIKMALS